MPKQSKTESPFDIRREAYPSALFQILYRKSCPFFQKINSTLDRHLRIDVSVWWGTMSLAVMQTEPGVPSTDLWSDNTAKYIPIEKLASAAHGNSTKAARGK